MWDGFVDESGRYTVEGPDFEGQIRRLRSADGVHFTKAGAIKLAHYVERELRRALSRSVVPVALPAPDEPAPSLATPGGGPAPRPVAGPVVPLNGNPGDKDELLGGGGRAATPAPTPDPTASRVLVRGEAVAPPKGRADDFAWPPPGAGAVPDEEPAPVAITAPAPAKPGAKAAAVPADGKKTKADAKNPPAPDAAPVRAREIAAGRTRRSAAAAGECRHTLTSNFLAQNAQRGSVVVPMRNLSTAWAHCRPSRIAHTTSD